MSAHRVVILRHGRTTWNAQHRIQGQAEVELDVQGQQQARSAAEVLAQENIDGIVASDLVRTRETAEALAKQTGLSVEYDARLRERGFGPWQGMYSSEVREKYPKEYAQWRAGLQPDVAGVETYEQLYERTNAAVRDAARRAPEGSTVCVVTHGGAAIQMMKGMLGWPTDAPWLIAPLGNCAWADLRLSPAGWRLYAYNVRASVSAESRQYTSS